MSRFRKNDNYLESKQVFFALAKKKRLGYNPWRIKYYKQNVIYAGIQTTPSSLIDKFLG